MTTQIDHNLTHAASINPAPINPARTRRRQRLTRTAAMGAAAGLLLLGVTACGSSSQGTPSTTDVASSTAAATSAIIASDAWVREPLIPDSTGAYATLKNSGAVALTLTGVSVPSDVAMSASVHEMVMKGDQMEMQAVTTPLEIPAGGMLELKPSGYHVMLMEPGSLTLGQMVPITFTFSDDSTVVAQAEVKAPPPSASASPSMSMSMEGNDMSSDEDMSDDDMSSSMSPSMSPSMSMEDSTTTSMSPSS